MVYGVSFTITPGSNKIGEKTTLKIGYLGTIPATLVLKAIYDWYGLCSNEDPNISVLSLLKQ